MLSTMFPLQPVLHCFELDSLMQFCFFERAYALGIYFLQFHTLLFVAYYIHALLFGSVVLKRQQQVQDRIHKWQQDTSTTRMFKLQTIECAVGVRNEMEKWARMASKLKNQVESM